MKKVFVLGSTGSIGINCLNVINNLKHDFEVAGLTVNSNTDLLLQSTVTMGDADPITGSYQSL